MELLFDSILYPERAQGDCREENALLTGRNLQQKQNQRGGRLPRLGCAREDGKEATKSIQIIIVENFVERLPVQSDLVQL